MTADSHLIAIAVGPVQDFIAQARRSRDLWYGSHILSEIARSVARRLTESFGAALVFPALAKGDVELEPPAGLRRPAPPGCSRGPLALAISNKVLAILPPGVDSERAARGAREAAHERWQTIAEEVFESDAGKALIAPAIRAAVATKRGNVWDEQVDQLLEVYAAWTQFDSQEPAAFDRARIQLDKAIAARKTLRDFAPQDNQRPGAPKSSLDGGRVSVLAKPGVKESAAGKTYREFAERYRIPGVEQLDAVGLIKRCGGPAEQFVPIANVAMATWLSAAAQSQHGRDLLDGLNAEPDVRRFGTIDPRLPHGERLEVDAQCLVETRLVSLLEEAGLPKDHAIVEHLSNSENGVISQLQRAVAEVICRTKGAPAPSYVAVLAADGDGMGALIEKLSRRGGGSELRDFSVALSEFAPLVETIVDEHQGSLIYAGGDDVLAFLPLETAVPCANALRQEFSSTLQDVAARCGLDAPKLSVGLGVGHFLVGMAELLELGRAAERLAKGRQLPESERRNALAIIFDKRSGSALSWRRRWPDDPLQLVDAAIRRVHGAEAEDEHTAPGTIAMTKLYQVRRDLRKLPRADASLGDAAEENAWIALLAADVRRTLRRSSLQRHGDEERRPVPVLADFGLDTLENATSYRETVEAIDDWFALHVMAKEIDRSTYHAVAHQPEPAGGQDA